MSPRTLGSLLVLMIGLPAVAGATAPLPAQLEQEARHLEAALVAPCCWSQQVSVHQSPAATEVKEDIRRRLARGETRQQILDDYVVQFGERILIEPPARGYKLLLYVFPPVALPSAVGDVYFGDGALRLVTPFSPAIRLGATHVFGIGIRSQRAADSLWQEELGVGAEARHIHS